MRKKPPTLVHDVGPAAAGATAYGGAFVAIASISAALAGAAVRETPNAMPANKKNASA